MPTLYYSSRPILFSTLIYQKNVEISENKFIKVGTVFLKIYKSIFWNEINNSAAGLYTYDM